MSLRRPFWLHLRDNQLRDCGIPQSQSIDPAWLLKFPCHLTDDNVEEDQCDPFEILIEYITTRSP
jgi:hypothetical protein